MGIFDNAGINKGVVTGEAPAVLGDQTIRVISAAITDVNGVPLLADNITAREITDLLNLNVQDIVDNGDETYTVTKTDGSTFVIQATSGTGNDPRLRIQDTQPTTDLIDGLIWINTSGVANVLNIYNSPAGFSTITGTTNLAVTEELTSTIITSSTGSDATIREASGARAGVISAANALKLNTINYRGSWTNSLGTNAQPYLLGDIVFDDTSRQLYQLDAVLSIVPTAQQNSRPHLTRINSDDGTPIWNLVSAAEVLPFNLESGVYEEGTFVTSGNDLYLKRTSVQTNGIGTQLTNRDAWFLIPGEAQPHPHPENLEISVSPTHVIQNSSTLTATVTLRETGDNWEITSVDNFSASRVGITSGAAVIASGGQSATISVNIPASALTTAGTISLSASVSGRNTVTGQTYTNSVRSVRITVQAAWFVGVRTTAPTATSQLVSQGVFQVGDSTTVAGIEGGSIYVAVPAVAVDENLRFTTSNPNLFYSFTEETAIGTFNVYNLGTATAGNYTVRIGGI